MRNIFEYLKNLIGFIWFPILLLGIFLFLIHRITGYQDPETIKVTLGITLGVALGFLADILKRSLDDYKLTENLKRTAFSLLKNDAENIYRSVEQIKEIRENKASAPKELQETIEKSLPPELEMRYWNKLNQEKDFLLLGSTEPFKSIFRDLWELEKINQLITEAQQGEESRRKTAYMFAMAIYNSVIEDRHHERLLRRFMSDEEFNVFNQNWKKINK